MSSDRNAIEFVQPDESPVKAVHRTLDSALRTHQARVDVARKALAHATKQHAARVAKVRAERDRAGRPSKIASIGIVQRVVLTETTVKTPKGEFPLTTDVQARAEQHGNKQVVQGWVFKSDQDRREVYLHLEGPDWGVVVPFSIKHSISEPRELHEFASKVGVAARNVEHVRAEIAARVAATDHELADALADRGAVDAAAEAFVAAAWELGELIPVRANVEALLARADRSDRKVRKLAEALDGAIQRVGAWQQEALQARQHTHHESAAMVAEARGYDERALPQAAPALAPATPEPEPSEADIFELIRKLGELRALGLVTPEEFEAKKADLLSRL